MTTPATGNPNLTVNICDGLVIDVPHFFADPDFQAWLNNDEPKFTWHRTGIPNSCSDVVVMVDASLSGEGTDSDMPEHIWDQIVEACRNTFKPSSQKHHIMVRLTNVHSS